MCDMGERLVKDMIAIFGGLCFRSMDLFRVKYMQLLLGACTETLETLRLYPLDPDGKDSFKLDVGSNLMVSSEQTF